MIGKWSSDLLIGAGVRSPAEGLELGLANDDSESPQKRAARQVMAAAEKAYASEELAECVTKATEAVKAFQDAGCKPEQGAAMRLLIDAYRQESLLNAEARPSKALEYADENIKKFHSSGEKVLEGSMQLATAEIYTADIKGSAALETAEKSAAAALGMFKDASSKSLEAAALLALANIHFLKGRGKDVGEVSGQALEIYKGLNDKLGEARALHCLALSYLDAEDYDKAARKAREALQIYRTAGIKHLEASELLVCALLNLEGDKASKAQPLAQDALNILRDTRTGKGGLAKDAFALHVIAESLCRRQQDKKAMKAVKDAEDHFQKIGSDKALAYSKEIELHTLMKLEKLEDALAAGEEAIRLVKQTGDKKMEINILHYMMRASAAAGDIGLATKVMQDAASIAQSIADPAEEGLANHEIAKLYLRSQDGKVEDRNIDKAVSSANEARALFRGAGLKDEEASALMTVATGYFMRGDSDRARSEAMDAQDIFESEGYHKGVDYAMSLIIDCDVADENYTHAIEVGEKRRSLWEAIGNKKMEGNACCSLANVYYSNEDFIEAERLALAARGLYEACADPRGKVISSVILTQAYVAKLMMEESDPAKPSRTFLDAKNRALKAAADAVAFSGKAGDRALRAQAIMWRARALLWSFRHDDAKRAAEDAKKIFLDLSDASGKGQALLIIANALNLLNQRDKAIEACNECMEVSQGAEDFVTADAAKELVDALTAKPVVVQVQDVSGGDAPAAITAGGASSGGAVEKKGFDLETTRKKVFEIVKNVMAGEEEIEADSPLMEAGMDSLSSVQMVSDLAREFQMQMAPSLVFDFPTINALAEDIVAQSQG